MDVFRDSDCSSVDADGETKFTYVCRNADREITEALLKISDEMWAKDQGPYEVPSSSGWDEAVKGWGWCSPLAAIIHTEKKGRKCSSGKKDYHCILCKDMKRLPEYDHKSVLGWPTSSEDHENKGSVSNTLLMKRPLSQPFAMFSRDDGNSYKVSEYTTFELESRISKEDSTGKIGETLPKMAKLAFQSHGTNEGRSNMIVTMNKFSVLPPVQVGESDNVLCPNDWKKSCDAVEQAPQVSTTTEDASHGLTSAKNITDLGKGGVVATADSHKSVICKYWSPQTGHHVLGSLNLPVSTVNGMTFGTCGGMVPLAPCHFGGHLKQDNLSSKTSQSQKLHTGLKSKTMKHSEPQLPLVVGTRVTIPVSPYRLL